MGGRVSKDLSGFRFGKWVVLGRARDRLGRSSWFCRCDCGTDAEVFGCHLSSGHSKSCGCVVDFAAFKKGSASQDWYSPKECVEATRLVMGGIGLDPASSAVAQARVRADRYYDQETDGLSMPWEARSVFMNPPYKRGVVDAFVRKLLLHLERGDVGMAVLLVNAHTSTRWFQAALAASSCFCLPRNRLKFTNKDGREVRSASDSVLVGFNVEPRRFERCFLGIGPTFLPAAAAGGLAFPSGIS